MKKQALLRRHHEYEKTQLVLIVMLVSWLNRVSNADPDIPVLIAAKTEYAKLK